MPLVFTVTNTSRAAVTLQLQGRNPIADFRVYDARGRVVWSLLAGKTLLTVLRLFPLEAGKTLTFRHVWNQRADSGRAVPAGDYQVRGVLLTDTPDGLASPSLRLTILP